jgi:hypothetical protein
MTYGLVTVAARAAIGAVIALMLGHDAPLEHALVAGSQPSRERPSAAEGVRKATAPSSCHARLLPWRGRAV